MFALTVYLKDHNRKPVRFSPRLLLRDIQADLPLGWCSRCGSEVFQQGQDLCIHCRIAKGEKENAA